MSAQRRSRMDRTARGKSLALTERDVTIFRTLSRYRYLRSTYLHAFAGGASQTRFKERLGDLFHEGYIDRPKQQWAFADARSMPAICELGERGLDELQRRGEGEDDATTFLAAHAHRQFTHSLAICEALASIELATLGARNIRFIAWPEILRRAPEQTRALAAPFRIPVSGTNIVPDGLFGLEYSRDDRKAYRFFALEMDRGTMPITRSDARQTSLLGKFRGYREIVERQLHKSHWGVSTLFVLTLTTGERRRDEILRAASEAGLGPAFLFKAIGRDARALAKPMPALLFELWERARFPPLNIAE